jgi:hypothetical protein
MKFQFRLRTLLIGVTLFCVVVGWLLSQASVVWERKTLLRRAPICGADDNDSGISWVRHLFGDAGVGLIQLDASASDDELAQYRAAFPEASVFRSPVIRSSSPQRSMVRPSGLTHPRELARPPGF